MGTATRSVKVQVVVFGYSNPQIEHMAPYGFVLMSPDSTVIYSRADVKSHPIPEVFRFTATQLPTIILDEIRKAGKAHISLHEFLISKVFNGLGSFRIWDGGEQQVGLGEIDWLSYIMRKWVDDNLKLYINAVQAFEHDCSPAWSRLQNPDVAPTPEPLRTLDRNYCDV